MNPASRQKASKARKLFLVVLYVLCLPIIVLVSLFKWLFPKRIQIWVNPAKLTKEGNIPPLSFYRAVGSVLKTPDGRKHLVTRSGVHTLSWVNGDALQARTHRAAVILGLVCLVALGEGIFILSKVLS